MTPFADHLRGLDRAALGRLLARRPDVASRPEPGSLLEVAHRLASIRSVQWALEDVGLPALQVLEALSALGGTASMSSLAALLEPNPELLTETLRELVELAVIVQSTEGTFHLPLASSLAPEPLGLGHRLAQLLPGCTAGQLREMIRNVAPKGGPALRKSEMVPRLVAALSDGAVVRRLVELGPPEAARMLRRAAWHGPWVTRTGGYTGRMNEAATWAIERGLLTTVDYSRLEMPAEVALALRGPAYRAPLTSRPAVPVHAVAAADQQAAGAAAVTQTLADVGRLLDYCDKNPLALTKAGRPAIRDVRRMGKALALDEPASLALLATALAADLLGVDGAAVALTGAADVWRNAEPADRLALLVAGWWFPTGQQTPTDRRRSVEYLVGLPPGTGVRNGAAAVAGYLRWRSPAIVAAGEEEAAFEARIAALWESAERLGIIVLGAATPLARALWDAGADQNALAKAAAELTPAPIATATFLSDLSVVVGGPPGAALAGLLDSAATREAAGTASTWRFSPDSVRGALDAGARADGLLSALAEVATGELPQALRYLVHDVARRHGQARVAPAGSVICAEDPVLLAEIVASRGLAGLGLRAVAPTVVVSQGDPEQTLTALRAAGYAPTSQDAAGITKVERRSIRRAPASGASLAAPWSAAPIDADAIAGRLLDAPEPASFEPPLTGADPINRAVGMAGLSPFEHQLLVDAVVTGEPVRIDYVSATGQLSNRVIEIIELTGDAVIAWCRLRDAERMFVLSRIRSISPAE